MAHINWLARKLEQLQKDRKVLAKIDQDTYSQSEQYEQDDTNEDKPFDYFQHFCHTIADRAKQIWILDDGYEAFKKEYPFLCGHVDWSKLFPLPHQVNCNLFLGTRVFPLEKDCLNKLEITHVIVSDFQKINWRELDGISVLRCSVKDENDQPMLPCWKACYQFITEALGDTSNKQQVTTEKCVSATSSVTMGSTTQAVHITDEERKSDVGETDLPNMAALRISASPHEDAPDSPVALVVNGGVNHNATSATDKHPDLVKGTDLGSPNATPTTTTHRVRVLVMLHGRSRSSSVILAYLIKAYRMNFGEAWTYLSSKCWHIIDRSLVYVDQLKQWEQTELASLEEF